MVLQPLLVVDPAILPTSSHPTILRMSYYAFRIHPTTMKTVLPVRPLLWLAKKRSHAPSNRGADIQRALVKRTLALLLVLFSPFVSNI
jgi:hypothetical protein